MSRLTDLSGDVTGLLTAIVEALDMPVPSIQEADEREHYRLLERRSADVRIALAVLLRHPGSGALDDTARDIRDRTAYDPVTYTTPYRSQERGADE
ncbi:hypothetical protein BJP40_24920 [Streptomyces sp. CC53]|uniref:hypothetical protein n=1 Tax=Streptomyces sp. CC53 TaxID=1906740 RepID=UPI0008DE3315|nr:hypothetical protein [Streptomyces sp. CC53]OII63248.1 hypothetical protein BJP40_24920 [Streptomyces sp. CC53]